MTLESSRQTGVVLLEALCAEWLSNQTPAEIGCDIEKVRLLKIAAGNLGVSGADLAGTVQALYQQVFLRSFDEIAATA